MPRVNTTSLREEVSLLKKEYARLRDGSKLSPEVKMLLQSVFVLFDLVIAVFLEKSTKKTGKNSGLPSSQTEKDDTSVKGHRAGKRGRQEQGDTCENMRTVETVTVVQHLWRGAFRRAVPRARATHQD
jgi:transposase